MKVFKKQENFGKSHLNEGQGHNSGTTSSIPATIKAAKACQQIEMI
jgi:hypothetical protein